MPTATPLLRNCLIASLVLAFSAPALAWKQVGKWECCGKTPRERVQVLCNSGFMPTFVNVDGKWYLKKKDQPDGQGKAFPSLDAAARDFCKE